MKTILIHLEENEYRLAKKIKGTRTWKEVLLNEDQFQKRSSKK